MWFLKSVFTDFLHFYRTRGRIHERIFVVSGHNFWDFSYLRFTFTMFTLQTNYKPVSNHFCTRGGGGVNSVVKLTVNSTEENSQYFFPHYIWHFGLSSGKQCGLLKKTSKKILTLRKVLMLWLLHNCHTAPNHCERGSHAVQMKKKT